MKLLYSPLGQPTQVQDYLIKQYLERGYSLENNHRLPQGKPIKPVETFTRSPEVKRGLLNINKAPKEELVKLPGIGSVIADYLIETRPYESFEKLEENIPRVDWQELKERLAL